MRALNLAGQVFGELSAVSAETREGKRGWVCKCSCGESQWIPTFQLTSGNNKKCSILKNHQIIKPGDRFGKLVVQRVYKDTKNRRYMSWCTCDCGKEKHTSFRNLQRGTTTHCGCSKDTSHLGKPAGISAFNALVGSYKSNAKSKSLEFSLTNQECEELFKGECYYCGQTPSEIFTKKHLKGEYIYSGIDRIDSNKGYFLNNVVSCCTACNFFKGNRSNKQFLDHIQKIYKHLN